MSGNSLKNQILKDLLVAVLRMALSSLGADFPLCLLVSALAANNRQLPDCQYSTLCKH